MNTLEIQTSCPECKSSLIDDVQSGELICSTCGIVVAEQMADYGPETRSTKSFPYIFISSGINPG